MGREPLFDPADFRIEPGVAHLCAAGESAFLRAHDQAFADFAADTSRAEAGRDRQFARERTARGQAAALFGVDASEIGFVSNVAEGMSILAESVAWVEGDTVHVNAIEFPSVALPFSMGGVELSPRVEARTRVVAVSHVSYLTGERRDLVALREAADRHGALLVVDFSQSAGVLPVEAYLADFAFSACYKFLLGCTGVAVAYWNRRRQPGWTPRSGGWNSVELADLPDYQAPAVPRPDAARFTRGNPALPSVYVLSSALEYLARYDRGDLAAHVEALAGELLDGLAGLRIEPLTPREAARRGPSVSIPAADPQGLARRLAARSVLAWGGQGRLRLSFHGYNGSRDVEQALSALRIEL